MTGKVRFAKTFIALLAASGLGLVLCSGPASAAAPGIYSSWTISPSDAAAQNHTGTIGFPNALLPGADYTSNKSSNDGESVRVATGTATYGDWLTTQTPFGALFGPSGPSTTTQFLRLRIGTTTVSTTTYTFREPFPADRLGIAFGDIDVDFITLTATDENGDQVPGSKLVGSTFNYCDVTVDKPTDCNAGPYRIPVWTPSSNGGQITPTPPSPGIVESSGASAMFVPSVSLKTLTVVFQAYPTAGDPSYRTWFAAFPRTKITTDVKPDKEKIPEGGEVDINVSTGNEGDFDAGDVETCLKIPKRFVVVKKDGTSLDGRNACWTATELKPGGETDKEITVRPTGDTSGDFTFQSTATSPDAGQAGAKANLTVKKKKKKKNKPNPKPNPKPQPPTG